MPPPPTTAATIIIVIIIIRTPSSPHSPPPHCHHNTTPAAISPPPSSSSSSYKHHKGVTATATGAFGGYKHPQGSIWMAVLQPKVRLFIELSTTRVFVWLSLTAGGGGDVGLALISNLRVRSGRFITPEGCVLQRDSRVGCRG
ncbi:hypothetical protein Tco_1071415 [Tanacetum coccineum]